MFEGEEELSGDDAASKKITYEKIAGLLTLIPAAGFILALSHQYAFLKTLGVSPFDVLQISDMVLLSAIYVLPACAGFFVIMLLQGWGDFFSGAKPSNIRAKSNSPQRSDIFDYIFLGTIYFGAFIFTLFGAAPEIGAFFLILVLWRFILGLIKPHIEHFLSDTALTAMAAYTLIISLFISQAVNQSFGIQSGSATLPVVQIAQEEESDATFELVANYSGGILYLSRDKGIITFLDDNNSRLIFRFDPEPPRVRMH
ncbi:hypothetical protein AB9K35_16325 [Leisingera sp. XS_AS12]|uniref:hypothetical protein n=1 Tax=Leisingera sp. XS_AS12 TaxID=3241294 RepID=UPI0035186AC5